MDKKLYRETNHPGIYYQEMLADKVRMQTYQAAIREIIRPGCVVADIGTGTGILAMMAARAGAAHVYAIEARPHMIEMCEAIVSANGLADTVSVVLGDAKDIQLEREVDVVINELIGDFGTDENIVESVAGFVNKNLSDSGIVLPERLTTFMVPIEYGDEFRGVFREDYYGFDLRPAINLPFQATSTMRCLYEEGVQLAAPQIVEDIVFNHDLTGRNADHELTFEISRQGSLQGFVGFFDAILTGQHRIISFPCYPSGHWQNWNWPVSPPIKVVPGEKISGHLYAPERVGVEGWTFEWQHDPGH